MSSHTSGPFARDGLASALPAPAAERTADCVPLRSYCIVIRSLAHSNAGVVDEFLRRRLAPLRRQRLVGRNQVRAVREFQAFATRPVLVHACTRIGPIMLEMAAQQCAAE